MKKLQFSKLFELVLREHMRLIYLGVAILLISYVAGWTDHNWILFLGLGLEIIGIILYIIKGKKESNY